MSGKEVFISAIEQLLNDVPDFFGSDEEKAAAALHYFETLKVSKAKEKPLITEKGVKILETMQENADKYNNVFKAKDVAELMFCSSRSVSGSMRKLVTDGFVEKTGNDPTVYSLTDKGMDYQIEVIVDESENF